MNDRLKTVADCLAGYKDADGNAVLGGTSAGANFDGEISRAQFAAILVRLAVIDGETKPAAPSEATFADVPTTNALFAEVEAAVALGLFDGTSQVDEESGKNLFLPGGNITFAQVVKALHNYMVAQGEDLTDDGNGADTGLDCKAFDAELTALEGRGILSASSTLPADCIAPATRGQAFDALAGVNSYQVAVDPARENPFPVPTNAGFSITPGDEVTLEWDDDRQFSLSGGVADTDHEIVIFPAENVTDTDGVFTFADSDNDGFADDIATNSAFFTVVNGAPAATGDQDETAQPVNGTITFTVESGDTEEATVVVFFDANGNGQLDLNDDGTPVDDEVFGVSGQTNWIPGEGTDNAYASGTVTAVNGTEYMVLDDSDTFYFAAADTYRNFSFTTGFFDAVTSDVFFANLSVGDSISTGGAGSACALDTYNSGAEGTNWCLVDTDPAGPGDVAATAHATNPDTKADLAWTPEVGIDSQNVYMAQTSDACDTVDAADYMLASALDADADEYEATGLAPEKDYCFWVNSVSGQDESAVTAGSTDGLTTSAVVVPPTITSSTLSGDAVVEGLIDAGDEFTFVFSETMDATTVGALLIKATDADGDTFWVDCAGVAADAAAATCTIETDDDSTVDPVHGNDDGIEGNVVIVTLDTDPTDRNAAGDGDLLYPATITAFEGLTDDNDGVTVDLAGSADLTL